MDDHMLDRIREEIRICFIMIEFEKHEGEPIKDHYQYKSAAILIKAYNALVKLYYKPEYIESELLGPVDRMYKRFLEIGRV